MSASRKRLRVALVTNRFLPQIGGAEINIDHQARFLARSVDLTVFCPKRVDVPDREERDGFRIVRLHDVANPRREFPNQKAYTFCPAIFLKILTGRFDVVHCFPALNRNNLLALLAAKLCGARTVFCFFDYLDYAAMIRETGRIDPFVLASHRPNWKTRQFLRIIDHIFAISNREIAFLRKFNPSVSYSPVPVLVEEFQTPAPSPLGRYGIPQGEFVFLVLNRICAIKGQDIALDAFVRAASRLPGARMVFVGNDQAEPALAGRMRELVAARGLGERVLFAGQVPREELLGWLQHSDVQVVASRFMNSGAVVVESWISGTPVIQTDVVDPNLVVDGMNGFLYPGTDSDALAEKMVRAMQMRELLPAMAEAGKSLVIQKFTYEHLDRLYLETYARITGRRINP